MISALLLALAAAVLFGIGVYTIWVRRVPGPRWFRKARRRVPAWHRGAALLMLGFSGSMLAASVLSGWPWWRLLAALGGCAPLVLEGIMFLREPADNAWYRMPPPIDNAGAAENAVESLTSTPDINKPIK
jgi:hypothetical protein